MVSAFVLFMGEAIISYRILPFDHLTQKLVHLLLQSLALATSTVGLYMIISYHEEQKPPIDNFYNIHGIVGITAYVLFVVQYFAGLTSMVWPRLADAPRAAALPYHKYIGQQGRGGLGARARLRVCSTARAWADCAVPWR